MDDEQAKEFEEWFHFIGGTVEDSPHCCDIATMKWHWKMLEQVKKIVADNKKNSQS